MTLVLILAPFPFCEEASFGGDARTMGNRRLFEALGWRTKTAGIYAASAVGIGQRNADDIVLDDPALARLFHGDMAFGGLHLATAASNDPVAKRELRTLIEVTSPDVVMVEHPWPWPLLRSVFAELEAPPQLIYSSHNIEAEIRPLLYRYCPGLPDAETRRREVLELERSLAMAADLVLAISSQDAAFMHKHWGVNATVLPPLTLLDEIAPESVCLPPTPPYAAFVSSAYWPNIDGYFTTFADGLGFLRQGEYLAVAGSAGPAIESDRRFRDFYAVNQSRFRPLGVLATPKLARFLRNCACVALPIHVSGGANMKTADALWSGRPVVCTPKALVGYEYAAASIGRGIYVADNPSAFRGLVKAAVQGELASPTSPAAYNSRQAAMVLAEALGPLEPGSEGFPRLFLAAREPSP